MEENLFARDAIERVLKVQGYGRKTAPFWFLGMEEGGGSIEQLRVRAESFDPVEDLHAANSKLGFPNMYRHVPTWRIMSKLTMAMQGTPEWRETSKAREYQAT